MRLSTTFPAGEAFFVESVRTFRDGAPPKLAEEIKAFTTQEAIHSREHDAFNKRAARRRLRPVEARGAGREAAGGHRDRSRRSSASRRPWRSSISPRSSPTSCSPIRSTSRAPTREAADLWRWHAVEEIEHKGVAYDTWLHATRDWPRCKRWKVKAKVMLYVTRNFLVDRTAGALELMRQDGVTGLRGLGSAAAGICGSGPACSARSPAPGSAISCPASIPWNEDDRHLLAAYDASAATGAEAEAQGEAGGVALPGKAGAGVRGGLHVWPPAAREH